MGRREAQRAVQTARAVGPRPRILFKGPTAHRTKTASPHQTPSRDLKRLKRAVMFNVDRPLKYLPEPPPRIWHYFCFSPGVSLKLNCSRFTWKISNQEMINFWRRAVSKKFCDSSETLRWCENWVITELSTPKGAYNSQTVNPQKQILHVVLNLEEDVRSYYTVVSGQTLLQTFTSCHRNPLG